KDREIVLPKANRNYDKIPPSTPERRTEELDYFFNTIHFPLPLLDIRMRPLRMRDPLLEKTYGNYVRGGAGNFGAAYLEGYFNSKRNEKYSYGAHASYEGFSKGPVAGKNSSSSDLGAEVFGKYFTSQVTFSGEMGYQMRNRKFYGADDVIEDAGSADKQRWQNFFIHGVAENTDKDSPVDYRTGFSFSSLGDKYDASESVFNVDAFVAFEVTSAFDVQIDADLYLMGIEDSAIDRTSRNLFRINPTVGFEYEGFRIRAGFTGVQENDTINGFNKFHFYPDVQASYTFNEQIDLYAGIGGDIQMNNLHRYAGENPFLNRGVAVYNSNKTFELYGGLKGRVSSKMGFEAGFSISSVKNLYFYLNDTTQQERFNVVYDDGSTGVVNIFGAFAYTLPETLRVNVRGDYWGYTNGEFSEAWHRPNYKLSVTAYYNLFDKINLNGEVYTMGGIKAYDFAEQQTVGLKAFFDLNFMAEYLVSERFSAFIRMNNIFSNNYERLYRYPVRGLQFMAGASYTF
ncbi:MAG: hypothetical protein P8X57_05640, partial [Cyclobacteriaceae bacterium]